MGRILRGLYSGMCSNTQSVNRGRGGYVEIRVGVRWKAGEGARRYRSFRSMVLKWYAVVSCSFVRDGEGGRVSQDKIVRGRYI